MKTLLFLATLFSLEAAMAVTIKIDDHVRSISDKGEKFVVTFKKHSAFYHVLKGSPQEKSVLPVLRKALESKKELNLSVDPDTKEIMAIDP